MTAWVCVYCGSPRLGQAWASSVWLRGRAGASLFLTLVPVLVYLLSGMCCYVRFNLSGSTCPSVTWATGQHTHTHTHGCPHWLTHRQQLNDMACLCCSTAYCVHTAKLYDAYCTHIHKCFTLGSLCPDACTFMTNNWAFTVTQQR